VLKKRRHSTLACVICGYEPRMFELFGGTYWVAFVALGRGTDRRVCRPCAAWASHLLGV
jgi:hypothetical protein